MSSARAQIRTFDPDTVRAGPFDTGKMWTFEYAPSEYFTETYGFDASPDWFERIRLSVLRIPGCSASFVSPNGLVATNHHCVRGAIAQLSQRGESLLDTGFYAAASEQERPIPGFRADRLIAIEDVTGEVHEAVDRAPSDEARQEARAETVEEIQERLGDRFASGGEDVHVEVVALYQGGRYSAYVFRRFTDVRLVAAAELQLGFFGGDPDNFTYPRYALDFAFLRVYDDGEPFRTDHYLAWGRDGVEEGDVVFVVGNPGPTNRLNTVAQLEFLRDVHVPALKTALKERLDAMRVYREEAPEEAEGIGIRNRMFSISNSLKANTGREDALRNPWIMAKRRDAERWFREAIAGDPELEDRFGSVIDRISDLQRLKRESGAPHSAFMYLGSGSLGSTVLLRALLAHQWLTSLEVGAPADSAEALRRRLLAQGGWPRGLERRLLAIRFAAFLRYLGPDHPVTQAALQGREPMEAALSLIEDSVLGDSSRTAQGVARGALTADDPALRLAEAILPVYRNYRNDYGRLTAAERELAVELGRARFAVSGTAVPPDATSSPRITDGVVSRYEYNGTVAPPYTTFFGLYDHFHSYGRDSDWNLPDRWLPPPPALDLNTPLNFVSTADTYGGNSGSPAITPELEIVGLNFDRNIEGLSRDYIYLPERGRNIMVDVRSIIEALDDVYDADRLVEELLTGDLVETEAEASENIR
jgi:hypothetical protein